MPISGLFQKNLFSVRKPVFVRLGKLQARPIVAVLRRHYPGLQVSETSRVRAFGINSQNWKIKSGRHTFVLKRVPLARTKTLEAQALWAKRLSDGGFPTARFLPNVHKALVSREDRHAYCLSYFEEGVYLGNSLSRWKELLKQQRRLIDRCMKYAPKNGGSRFGAWDCFSPEARSAVRLKKISGNPLRKAEMQYITGKYEQLYQAYCQSRAKWRRAVFHIDMHPLNLLFRGDRLSLLADFDSFRSTILEISLGFSTFKCSRELLVGVSGRRFGRKMLLLQKIFHRYLGSYTFKTMLSYGQMDVLQRLLSILHRMSKGDFNWTFMLKTQLAGMKEIDAMLYSLNTRQ